MTFLREASAAIMLVTLTLLLQCAGIAALISWGRTSLAPEVHRLGPIRSAMLMVRFITAFIVLHIFEILLWAAFYRWLCFPLWESAFYFSAASYATVGYGDITPLTLQVRYAAVAEGIAGQYYLAILVARLVAMQMNQYVNQKAKDQSREAVSQKDQ